MKIGAENRARVAIMVVVVALAVFLLVKVFSGPSPTSAAAAPARPAAQQSAAAAAPGSSVRSAFTVLKPTLDPRLRLDLLKQSESMAYTGAGRNIFSAGAEPLPQPKFPAEPNIGKNQPPQPLPPSGPPPIDLKFYGFASRPGEAKKIFLSHGEDIFMAAEGDVIDRRYKIIHINPTSVEIEDLLSNNRQTIPLTQG